MKKKIMAVLLITILMLTVIAVGTYAYFTSQATSKDNTFVAGTLKLGGLINGSDVENKFAHLNAANLKPNDTMDMGSVTLKNMGSLPFKIYRITASKVVDSGALDNVLTLKLSVAGRQIFNGRISDLQSENGGYFYPVYNIKPGETPIVNVQVTMDPNAGNAYQNKSLSCDFNIFATQNEVPINEKGLVVFADNQTPWGSLALNNELSNLRVDHAVYTSAQMLTVDLPIDKVVMIVNDQPQGFYDNYKLNQAKFDKFVQDGGTLIFGACDQGWSGGSILRAGATLPGGVTPQFNASTTNKNISPSHPIMTGLPTTLNGNSASHSQILTDLQNGNVLCINEEGKPTLVEYYYGHGRVIATGQTLEFGVAQNSDYAPIYDNMIRYALNMPIA